MMDKQRNTPWQSATPSDSQFANWFSIATKGLCEDAKRRIWTELSSHYADAAEANMAEGLRRDEAEGLAVEALGHPKKARRQFRKTYLTAMQAWLAKGPDKAFERALSKPKVFGLSVAVFLFISVGLMAAERTWEAAFHVWFWLAFGLHVIFLHLSKRSEPPRRKAGFFCAALLCFWLGFVPGMLYWETLTLLGYASSALFSFFAFVTALDWVLLDRKLRKKEHEA